MKHNNIEDYGYWLHAKLLHDELMQFIKPYLKPTTSIMLFYWAFNILLLFFIIVSFINQSANFGDCIDKFFVGFGMFFILIPIHELIHGIGYKIAGAPKVSYKADLKKMVFYAMADKFVTGKKQFIGLAIAPFLIINLALIITIILIPSPNNWYFLGALFIHTSGCSGDFALINYFYINWSSDPVTYDDIDEKVSYFYIKAPKLD